MTEPAVDQRIVWLEAINLGLIGVITDLAVAQVRLRSDDRETALAETVALIEASMNTAKATAHSAQGPVDRSDAIRKALRAFLGMIEDNSRRSLGLVPQSRSRN